MPRPSLEENLKAIEAVLQLHSGALTAQEISEALKTTVPLRTLQYRLKYLVDSNRVIKAGEGRWARYQLPSGERISHLSLKEQKTVAIPLSKTSIEIQTHINRSVMERQPVGYNWGFLNAYRPNFTAYLTEQERSHLRQIGTPIEATAQPAGAHAKHLLNRLLIDLSWNSSRLEGNTYSLLDTKRLVDFGQEAEGKGHLEAQMILNHKDAIEFLVSSAEDIAFNRYTILNLHALLANNLLNDPTATGRLRRIPVGIEKSVYHPPEILQHIEEYFNQLLTTAAAIRDPFEQAFFAMVQLPYLQPFDGVNKRVSRLAANIPFIKSNLVPLSFADVPRTIYTNAMLDIYELNKIDLFKDVFIWAYERSAARFAAIKQSLGEPDPFRLRYRAVLREVIAQIVCGQMTRKQAFSHLTIWAQKNIDAANQEKFKEIVEDELLSLHEGNFARYQIRPSEFEAWQKVWNQ